jgi:hypothetical protein
MEDLIMEKIEIIKIGEDNTQATLEGSINRIWDNKANNNMVVILVAVYITRM